MAKMKQTVYIDRGNTKNVLVTVPKELAGKSGSSRQIASFAGLVFRVSEEKALAFKDAKQEIGGRWSSHEIIGSRPKMEFLGPDIRTITLSTIVDVQLGYKPHAVLKKINKMAEEGKVGTIVIGTHKIGKKKWKLEKASEAFSLVYNNGELARAGIELTFSEYA